jgi:hypothetical protein
VAINESLVFDSIELNPVTPGLFNLDEIAFPTPKKRPEWVTGADADGAELVRDPLFEQRTIPLTVRVTATTRDAVHDGIAQLVAKCEEAEQQPGGLPLVWTPADSTESVTFYVLSGEVGDIPVTHESGYFANSVAVPITLTCKPFWYGAFVSSAATTSASTPLVTLDIPNITGDVPAEGTIVVTDLASKSRRDVIWGVEQRYYTPGSPTDLTLTASELVTSGFAGTSGAVTGAYSTNAITATVADQPTAVCGTGNQPHIGTYRIRARVQAGSVYTRFRLAWQDGDGPFNANPWVGPPVADGWCEIDLGEITIQPTDLGSQRWTGRVEAYATSPAAQPVWVNLLEVIPAGEGYGRARATYAYQPGVVVARDNFTTLGAGAALNGHAAPAGGNWVTAGDTTDFTQAAVATSDPLYPAVGSAVVQRATATVETTGRYGVLGGTMTDTEVSAVIAPTVSFIGPNNNSAMGVVARYVDTSNTLRAFFNRQTATFTVNVLVAGAQTAYNYPHLVTVAGVAAWRIRLVVFASGAVFAVMTDTAGTTVAQITLAAGAIAALAPGGVLASGKVGLFDQPLATGMPARNYGGFYAAIPPAEPLVVNSGQSLEFRPNGDALRRDTTGTYGGRAASYRGGRVLLQPAGDANRTSRVVVAARRSDTDTGIDGGVTDNTQIVVQYTPRGLTVPH